MATTTVTQTDTVQGTRLEASHYPVPLSPSGALDQFKHEEVTPVIGREYPSLNLVDDVINAKNADELIRDLAITSESFTAKSRNTIN